MCRKCSSESTAPIEVCSSCARTRYIMGDSDRFRFIGKGRYHLGVELEMEYDRDDGDFSVARFNREPHWFTKSDGSLSNGVEIVSDPMTWEEWQKQRPDVEAMLRAASKRFTSYNNETCGMHIHLSRTALDGGYHYARMVQLVNPDNLPFILAYTGRRKSALNQWARLPDKNDTLSSSQDTRYMAINKTTNTLEFRLFRGTLHAGSFYKNLLFVVGLTEYTRNEQNPTLMGFINYLKQFDDVRDYFSRSQKWQTFEASVGVSVE